MRSSRNHSFFKEQHSVVKLNVTSQHSRVDVSQVAFDPNPVPRFSTIENAIEKQWTGSERVVNRDR